MFNKSEFDEFIGEVSYLNESTKSLIKEIKEADSVSVNLKATLVNLEKVSNSLNFQITKVLNDNVGEMLKSVIDKSLKDIALKSNNLKDLSISISQSVEFLNQTSKKIEKRQKYHIVESLLYIVFFAVGLFAQKYFNIVNF